MDGTSCYQRFIHLFLLILSCMSQAWSEFLLQDQGSYSQSPCGLSRLECANSVCSWKAVKDTVKDFDYVTTCTWCSSCSTCQTCNHSIRTLDSMYLSQKINNFSSSGSDDVCDCRQQTCQQGILGATYCASSMTGQCQVSRMTNGIPPLYLQEEIIVARLPSLISCENDVIVYVRFNATDKPQSHSCKAASSKLSGCNELCAPIIIQDNTNNNYVYFFWQIASTNYKPKWTWETNSVYFNMSTYCCPSSTDELTSNHIIPVLVNVSFTGQLDQIHSRVQLNDYQSLLKCDESSHVTITITYPSDVAHRLSYIDPNTSTFQCNPENGFETDGSFYVPYNTPVGCQLLPSCSGDTPCAYEELEHNVLIRAKSDNCNNELKNSEWGKLLTGISMNFKEKYFVWNSSSLSSVPETLYRSSTDSRCQLSFQAVVNYSERHDTQRIQVTAASRNFFVVNNCHDNTCYASGSTRCNPKTLQCKCASACTGHTSYHGDICDGLPWCKITDDLVGISVGSFLGCAIAITICIIKCIRRGCRCSSCCRRSIIQNIEEETQTEEDTRGLLDATNITGSDSSDQTD